MESLGAGGGTESESPKRSQKLQQLRRLARHNGNHQSNREKRLAGGLNHLGDAIKACSCKETHVFRTPLSIELSHPTVLTATALLVRKNCSQVLPDAAQAGW